MKSNRQTIRCVRLAGALMISCLAPNTKGADLVGQEITKNTSEPEYYQIPKNHTVMHRAVLEARKTVGEFITVLKHPASGQQDFEVKEPFIEGNEVEHIWLSHVRLVGPRFEGRVDNKPQKIPGLKLGQLVSVNPNEISDWLYVDNGKLVGGYTVRAHYNELSPQQKREFDRAADFKIDMN
jgi:uncharacterized protein YegJ (DUF2314 family)